MTSAYRNTGGRESAHSWLWFVSNSDVYILLYDSGLFQFSLKSCKYIRDDTRSPLNCREIALRPNPDIQCIDFFFFLVGC